MKRSTFLTILFVLIAIALGALAGRRSGQAEARQDGAAPEQRFPRPELPAGYETPPAAFPAPRAALLEYVDTAALVAALALASYLALKKRSRSGIFVLMVCSLIYFGFVRRGCVCPIGAIQHVAAAVFRSGHVIPATVLLFFLLPLTFALFFGRVFCSSVCPIGAAQDVVLVRPLRIPRWLEQGLGLLAYAFLGLAVLFAATGAGFIICRYDPFVSFFRLSGKLEMFALGGSFLLISMFVGRPYCRYSCPYGVLLRLCSRVSYRRVTITPDECMQCRLCEDACPFGAIRKPTLESSGRADGKARLGLLIVALPLIVALAAWVGHGSSGVLAGAHPTVRQARAVRHDEAREDDADEERDLRTEAFLRTGRTPEQLYEQEAGILKQFQLGGALFGAWLGLVVAAKLIALSVRRKRPDYEAEPGQCVACGRCFAYCPREHLRLKALRGETETPNSTTPTKDKKAT